MNMLQSILEPRLDGSRLCSAATEFPTLWIFGILSIIIGEDKASITIKPEHHTELCL